jgi:hypothetical protein
MPTTYRAMKMAADKLPVVGPFALGLGVREPSWPHADVDVDALGYVVLNGKGMSVARHWRDLPRHRIPERLDDGVLGAIGPNSNFCWKMGQGAFSAQAVAPGLDLVLKPHELSRGNIVANRAVTLPQFQNDLAATRNQWAVDEA